MLLTNRLEFNIKGRQCINASGFILYTNLESGYYFMVKFDMFDLVLFIM